MATFAPELQPVNIPDWTNNSKPISQPEPDRSKGLALSAAASGIEDTTNVAEKITEQYLHEKVSAGVDALRDTTTAAYENIRNSQVTGQAPDPKAIRTAGFNGSLTAPGTTDIPDALQAGLDKATSLGLAKSQGKANDTLYTAALNSLSKELRSQYPGHKDFIDEQIAKISGVNPANAYMSNLLIDINRGGAKEDIFQKQVMAKAAENMGDPAVQKWWLATQHGLPNGFAGLTQAVFKAEAQKYQHLQWQSKNEETKGDLAASADLAKNQYEIRSAQIISNHINPIFDIPGLTTPAMMNKLVTDSQNGVVSLSPDQHNQLLSAVVAARRQAADHLQSVENNEGYAARIKDSGWLKSTREDQLGYFDRIITDITNNSYGSLFEAKRRADSMQDQTRLQANTSDMGDWLRKSKVIQDAVGPQWTNFIDALGLNSGKLKDLQSFMNDSRYRASVSDDVRRDGYVKSLYNDLDTAQKAIKQGAKAPDAVYDDLVHNVDLIRKANDMGKPEIAKEVVDYTFDPTKNAKLMTFFGKDFTDSQGKVHKGNFAVYDTLTQPKIVDTVSKIGDQESWRKFRDWNEMSFKTLFGERVKDLNNVQGGRNLPVSVSWDSDNHQIHLDFGKPHDTVDANYIAWAKDAIDNPSYGLNKGLKNLAYMHSKDGGDTNEYLFNTLMQLGYSPNDKLHGDNFPQRVIEAIKASQKDTPSDRIKKAFERSSE